MTPSEALKQIESWPCHTRDDPADTVQRMQTIARDALAAADNLRAEGFDFESEAETIDAPSRRVQSLLRRAFAAGLAKGDAERAALREARPYVQGVFHQLAYTNHQHVPGGVLARIDAALSAASGEAAKEQPKRGGGFDLGKGRVGEGDRAFLEVTVGHVMHDGDVDVELPDGGGATVKWRFVHPRPEAASGEASGGAKCEICEGTGKAFNAIDMEWDACLSCGGTGVPRTRPAPSEAPNVELVCESYPIILNGDHAEFEAEWAGKDPKARPDWPLPSFDARDWAEAFCKTADKVGHPNIDVEWVTGWFANALMRGYDHQAPRIAELEKERDLWKASGCRMEMLLREADDKFDSARAEGIAAERERAAKIAAALGLGGHIESMRTAKAIAAAIRSGAKP